MNLQFVYSKTSLKSNQNVHYRYVHMRKYLTRETCKRKKQKSQQIVNRENDKRQNANRMGNVSYRQTVNSWITLMLFDFNFHFEQYLRHSPCFEVTQTHFLLSLFFLSPSGCPSIFAPLWRSPLHGYWNTFLALGVGLMRM